MTGPDRPPTVNLVQSMRRIRVGLATSMVVLAACAPLTATGVDAGEVLFLTETVPAALHMQALYKGNVIADAAGCLRLAGTGEQHTVVWPFGFELRRRKGVATVVDPNGRVIGEIGGAFTLGGGEIPTLHDGIPLSDAQRAQARERCPGRYWIVGDVP